MNFTLFATNLLAYSLQIALLIAIAAGVPAIVRLRLPGARLVYWQILLGVCLLLPALRPWRQEVLTLSTPIVAPVAAPVAAPIAPEPSPIPTSGILLGVLACGVLAGGALVRFACIAAGFFRLARYRRHSLPLSPPNSWNAEAEILVSEAIASPVTFGFLHPIVLLPAGFPELDPAAQEAILCHEILHVRRHDWLFTIAEELVRAVFWFHPAIWWLLGEIALTREQAVDREVVALTQSRDEYLDALLAIAGAAPRLDLAPAPLFLRKHHLKQRVHSIMKEVHMSKTKSFSALAAGLGILGLACWLSTAAFPLAAAPQTVADAPGVTVDTGGAMRHRSSLRYPDAAIAAKVSGTVTLEATLDSTGAVTDVRVIDGPAELRNDARQAVQQWHYATDSSSATRTVKIQFELTPAAELAVKASVTVTAPRTNTPFTPIVGERIARIAMYGLSESTRAAVLAKLPVHEGDITTADTHQRVLAAVKSVDTNLDVAEIHGSHQSTNESGTVTSGSELTLVIDWSGALGQSTSKLGNEHAAAQMAQDFGKLAGKRIAHITVRGMDDAMRDELLSRLPVHEGDIVSDDLITRTMAAAQEFDKHIGFGWVPTPEGELTLSLSLPGRAIGTPTPQASPNTPKRITIGPNVQHTKLISQPKPVYPPLAMQARIQGVVHLQAIISTDGHVVNLQVISGHPLLISSAIDAVKQWVFQQTLLNGVPVEVQTQIDVNFTLVD
jgi:TonB family protein